MPCFHKVFSQPRDWLFLPLGLDLVVRSVTACVIRGRVIAKAVCDGFNEARPLSSAGGVQRLFHRRAHGNDIVTIDLLALNSRCDGLLRKGGSRRLHLEWYRNRPLIVVGDEYDGQPMYAGEVHCLPDVALRGGPVAKHADRYIIFACKPEGVGSASCVRCVGTHRHANWEIARRTEKEAAALVATPIGEYLLNRDTAPYECAVFAIRRKKNVVGAHGTRYPHHDRLLTERCWIGSETSRALEGHGFHVERADEHHTAIEANELICRSGELWQRTGHLP